MGFLSLFSLSPHLSIARADALDSKFSDESDDLADEGKNLPIESI